MKNAPILALLALIVGGAGCLDVNPPEGILECSRADECPSGWECIERRCYRAADAFVVRPDSSDVTDAGASSEPTP